MKNIVNYNNFVNEEFNLMDPFGRKEKHQLEEDKRKQKVHKRLKYEKYKNYIEDKFSDKVKKCGYIISHHNEYEIKYFDDVDFDKVPLNLILHSDRYNIQIHENSEKNSYHVYINDYENNKVINKKSDNIDKIFDYICKNYHGDYESI